MNLSSAAAFARVLLVGLSLVVDAEANDNYGAIALMRGRSAKLDSLLVMAAPLRPDAFADEIAAGRGCANTAGLSACQCGTAHYCCRSCQRAAWPTHKNVCKAIRSGEFKVQE
ncbi:hypothetical protein TeGR_g4567 [Tetraparma gracilis]|uniref:MYND-type domain-containing protein n=1 Tax=Tetraparma gracilis TaxID=2962635 RepID=A0ABQ6N6S8_9STRA|nr:hypothetical protein TeGR_g4567 [Tetraparma gracilis]